MLNLRPRHRVHLPNSLAIFAALLLFISAVTGFNTNQEATSSSLETTISTKAGDNGNDGVDHITKTRSGGLNLSLLLFRRG